VNLSRAATNDDNTVSGGFVKESALWTGRPAIQFFLARAWWRCYPAVLILVLGLGWGLGAFSFQAGGQVNPELVVEAYRLAGFATMAGLALLIPGALMARLEYRWTSYSLTKSFAVIRERRGLSVRTAAVPLAKVAEIRLERHLVMRRYGLGTITLVTTGIGPANRIYAIPNPEEVAALVTRLVSVHRHADL
jgi:membrane protein YdbS with pleckstrin-like domain